MFLLCDFCSILKLETFGIYKINRNRKLKTNFSFCLGFLEKFFHYLLVDFDLI